ncbi:MAG: hypothetical protein FWE14_02455 [Lachnospiraceae bacterium]|nr:hypothetical protein [Lachnospiraceae bacterium]
MELFNGILNEKSKAETIANNLAKLKANTVSDLEKIRIYCEKYNGYYKVRG